MTAKRIFRKMPISDRPYETWWLTFKIYEVYTASKKL